MYENLLKTIIQKLHGKRKHYEQLFEQVQNVQKNFIFFNYICNNKTMKYENSIVMKWYVIKEAIGEKSLAGRYNK